jgi:hypothetical protein
VCPIPIQTSFDVNIPCSSPIMDETKHQDNENVTVNFAPEEEKSNLNANTIHLGWNWDNKKMKLNYEH